MRRFATLFSVLLLVSCDQQPEGEPVVRADLGDAVAASEDEVISVAEARAEPGPGCQAASFENVSLTHCIADPSLHRIRTDLAPRSSDRLGTIEGWAAGRNESDIVFVMNGGMYADDLRAIGYFVRDSDRLVELNREEGDGNFYLKPNGVFFGSNGSWQILTSDTFLRTVGDRPQFGTQSGPMLVINGELHPEIAENGASRTIRNAVGVAADGKAHFVISNEPLSFGQLARFFRDELNVPNALFLDGAVSSLWDRASGRMDGRRVGLLLVVENRR